MIISPSKNCIACGACINKCPSGAITWQLDEYSVEYPHVDSSRCIQCGLCYKVCPLTKEFFGKHPFDCYACWQKDIAALGHCASGGVARLLSSIVLSKGGIVFGCTYSEGRNHHIKITDNTELDSISGSKYVWSDIENTFREVKNELDSLVGTNRFVLFIGTPCQVDGLKNYIGTNTQTQNLITVDLICHGVPPQSYIRDYILFKNGSLPQTLSCRNREGYVLHGKLKNGNVFAHHIRDDIYLQEYIDSTFYRENCYECRYARAERVGDITLGDFTGLSRDVIPYNAPELLSLVLVNSEAGSKLFSSAKEELYYYQIPVQYAIEHKDNLRLPQTRPIQREQFLQLYRTLGFAKSLEIIHSKNLPNNNFNLYKYFGIIKHNTGKIILSLLSLLCKTRKDKSLLSKVRVVEIVTLDSDELLLHNYGSFLQHFALRKCLTEFGFKAYRGVNNTKQKHENIIWWYNQLFTLAKVKRWLIAGLGICGLYRIKFPYGFYKNLFTILKFRKDYNKLIGEYHEVPEKPATVCISGSDQSLFCQGNEPPRGFLLNKPKEITKLAYAASSNWMVGFNDELWSSWAIIAFPQFKAISLREQYACKHSKALCPTQEFFHAIDPTFLISKESYLSLLPKKQLFKKKTLLCYLLHCDTPEQLHLETLRDLATQLKVQLQIIGIQGSEWNIPEAYGISPGPLGFLHAFRDADYIITNSFHGTAFSIIMEKNFVTMNQEGDNATIQNIRSTEILDILELQHRRLDNYSSLNMYNTLITPLNWPISIAILDKWLIESKEWLLMNLNDAFKKQIYNN